MNSQWGSQKLLQGLLSPELSLAFWFFPLFSFNQMTILSKEHKPGNLESYNTVKCSFSNISSLWNNFIEYKSFLKSNSPDILVLCETNMDGSIDFSNFSVKGYLSLIQMDSQSLSGEACYLMGTHQHMCKIV